MSSVPPSSLCIFVDSDTDDESDSVFGSEFDAYNDDWYPSNTYKSIYRKPVKKVPIFKEPTTVQALIGAISAAGRKNEQIKKDKKMDNSLYITLIQNRHCIYLLNELRNYKSPITSSPRRSSLTVPSGVMS